MAGIPVAIIMGSQSDWATMRHAAELSTRSGSAYDARIVSAHRTPDRLVAFAKGAKADGFQGGDRGRRRRRPPARHDGRHDPAAGLRRAGRIEVPLRPGQPPVDRADAGRHPGRNAGHRPRRGGQRGAAGGGRAGAARRGPGGAPRCLAPAPDRQRRRTAGARTPDDAAIVPGNTLGILGGGQLGRMLAMAAAQLGLQTPHLRARGRQPGLRRRAPSAPSRPMRTRRRSPASPARSTSSPTNSRTSRARPRPSWRACAARVPTRGPSPSTQDRLEEKSFVAVSAFPTAPFAAVASEAELAEAVARIRPARGAEDPPLRL